MDVYPKVGDEMTAHRSTADGPSRDGPEPTDQPSLSRRTFLAGSAGGLASLSGCVGGDASIVAGKRDESTETYDLTDGRLRVDAEHGNVTVREGSDAVRVEVVKSGSLISNLSAITVSSERDGDTVAVRSRIESDGWFLATMPDIEIDVDVPPGVVVESMAMRNGTARVEDVGVADGATIETENGNAVARRVDGDLAVETENGNVTAEGVAGFVDARSENGNVRITDCDGVDGATTENGTVSADVTAIRDDASVQSENGNVDARLARDLDAHVVAATENGTVNVNDALPSTDTETQTYVEGTLGDGTYDLRVRTTNSNVSLSRLS